MEITSEVYKTIIVSQRFGIVHNAAENAVNAVNELYFKLFDDMVTPEQKKQIFEALQLLKSISDSTNLEILVNHIKKINQ